MNVNNSEWVKQNSRLREEDCLPELRRRRMNEKVAARMFEIRENRRQHNPYDQEIRETSAIMQGDVRALEQSILEEYSGEIGILNEEDSLRNLKNLCIVVITLASRAAIRGGLQPELAFALSDVYISELERCRLSVHAAKLCRGAEYHLARLVRLLSEGEKPTDNSMDDYSASGTKAAGASVGKKDLQTEALQKDPKPEELFSGKILLQKSSSENEHVSRAKDYIYRNLHQKLGTEEIAGALALNPKYLSTLFHRETGLTISQYIRREKIRLVKNMLTYSDYSYLEIAHYLGFSSQSHLGEQFRRETGMTLKEYRQKYHRREI